MDVGLVRVLHLTGVRMGEVESHLLECISLSVLMVDDGALHQLFVPTQKQTLRTTDHPSPTATRLICRRGERLCKTRPGCEPPRTRASEKTSATSGRRRRAKQATTATCRLEGCQ